MATTLFDLFCHHLRGKARGGADAAGLAAELRASGFALEGELLERDGWTDGPSTGPWAGRKTYVGRTPPTDAALGTLWLDTVEVVAMVLVEEPARRQDAGPERAWFALRPVARWQFRAFVVCAPLVEREVQVAFTRPPFASAREPGDDLAPMTDVTFGEATLYASWFGKGTPNRYEWQGPARSLGDSFAALWTPDLHEWAGYGANEEHRIRFGADNWDRNPYGREGDEGDDEEDDDMVLTDEEHRVDTGFRTIAGVDPGSLSAPPVRLPTMEPIALERAFSR